MGYLWRADTAEALPFRMTAMAGGGNHSLGITSTGEVFAWGLGANGQLGTGSTAQSLVPVPVVKTGALNSKTITKVAAGMGHSMALDSNGAVYTWGQNDMGQLGIGTSGSGTNSLVPVAIPASAFGGKTITDIAAGRTHSVALASDGTVYTWGDNSVGQLGNNTSGTGVISNVPVAIFTGAGSSLQGRTVKQIASQSSANHTVVLADNNTVHTWGNNNNGQLGNNTITNSSRPVQVTTTGTPMNGRTITQVGAGGDHSLARASDGTAYAWGHNGGGRLGDGTTNTRRVPVAVSLSGGLAGKTITQLTGGTDFTVAVATDGRAYSWGLNTYGQLGNGNNTAASTAVAVSTNGVMSGKTVTSVTAGNTHAIALSSEGMLYAWGTNAAGRLGNGDSANSNVPVAVRLEGTPSAPANVWVTAGNGSVTVNWSAPITATERPITGYVLEYRAVGATSWAATPAIASSATSYTLTGVTNDTSYQLRLAAANLFGRGDYSDSLLATPHGQTTITSVTPGGGPIAGGTNVTINGTGLAAKKKGVQQVSAGYSHSLALGQDGKVYAWGNDGNGQLGDGSTVSSSSVPVAVLATGVLSGKTITQVATGSGHSLALASDGTVYAWGYNNNGQLGNGSTATTAATPVAVNMSGVLAGKKIIQIAAGYAYSLALASDGTVYAWGANAYGQLGNGLTTNSNVPVAVVASGAIANKKIVQITAGYYHSLALASDGTVYAWGYNNAGQLGNNSTTNASSPVYTYMSGVLAGKIITQLTAGSSHSLALASDGTVYAWGNNASGQIGNGSTVNYSAPVAVTTSGALAGKSINQIAGGSDHSLALASDGTVYAWGSGSLGRLGNGSMADSSLPVAVTMSGALAGKTIVQLTGGSGHSLALISDGRAYAWGAGGYGQLGNNSTTESNVPVAVSTTGASALATSVPSVTFGGTAATNINFVNSTTITATTPAKPAGLVTVAANLGSGDPLYNASLTNGYTYGVNPPSAPTNVWATPGDASATVKWSPPITNTQQPATSYRLEYRAVGAASWTTAPSIAGSASSHTITGLTNATQYQVRIAAVNQYGTGNYSDIVLVKPMAQMTITSVTPNSGPIAGGTNVTITGTNFALKKRDVTQISAGYQHSASLATDQTVHSWGSNNFGRLGNNSTANSPVPVAALAAGTPMEGKTITQVSAGGNHTLALASDGTIYAWGYNDAGQLGNDTVTSASVPIAVNMANMSGKTIVQVSAGFAHSVALASDGTVFAWGQNNFGQLGNGSTASPNMPVAITMPALAGRVATQISAGGYHTLVVTNDGTVFAWGMGSSGQLGQGTNSGSNTAVGVTAASMANKTIVQVSAGFYHSVALASDGTVHTWGQGTNGQLGNGTTSNSNVPIVVNSGTLAGKTITQVSAGSNFVTALASDNTIHAWGQGTTGQLGNGASTNSSVPVRVTATGVLAGKTITQISSGNSHSLALASDGTVYGWGQGNFGQLGNAAFANSNVPVAVSATAPSSLASVAPKVTFGGTEATNATVVNTTTIAATTPAKPSGPVTVATDLGEGEALYAASLASGYTYTSVPGVPLNLAAASADTGVNLTWTTPTDSGGVALTGYSVRYRPAGSSTWTTITVPNATSYSVTGLNAGVNYEFQVAAINSIGTGAYTTSVTGAVRTISISATNAAFAITPTASGAMSSGSATVTITTNAPAGYNLSIGATERNLVNGSHTIPFSTANQTTPGTLTGSMWGYRVDGIGGFGTSTTTQETNVANSAFTWAGIPALTAPTIIRNQSSAITNHATTVWYGARSSGTQASGNYITTVTYTALTN